MIAYSYELHQARPLHVPDNLDHDGTTFVSSVAHLKRAIGSYAGKPSQIHGSGVRSNSSGLVCLGTTVISPLSYTTSWRHRWFCAVVDHLDNKFLPLELQRARLLQRREEANLLNAASRPIQNQNLLCSNQPGRTKPPSSRTAPAGSASLRLWSRFSRQILDTVSSTQQERQTMEHEANISFDYSDSLSGPRSGPLSKWHKRALKRLGNEPESSRFKVILAFPIATVCRTA
mmetsp:Transcript_27382/g.40119  ORF Transcript_27382/g.40119 Transcript_27382/m.40119 type:complete len:231 (-) Transcript_27382:745-1437(-)